MKNKNDKNSDNTEINDDIISLSATELQSIPTLVDNPITSILIDLYTENSELKIQDLVKDLQEFVTETSLDNKLKFLFKIYDRDGDGYLTYFELFSIINKFCDVKMEKSKMLNLVDQSFKSCNRERIGFEEFRELIMKKTKNIEAYFMVD